MKYMAFFYIFFLNLLLGCSRVTFIDVEEERTELINGIESYQSIEEFKNFLTQNSLSWKVTGDSHNATQGQPPFDFYKITLKNYSHLGYNGDLEIEFFNNRLWKTRFFPVKTEEYIKTMEKTWGIEILPDQYIQISPHTLIRYAVLYDGRKYINWIDSRLHKEYLLWVSRYI